MKIKKKTIYYLSKNTISCPNDKPLLCGTSTKSMGICVENKEECKIRTLENRDIPNLPNNNSDENKYGYSTGNLGKSCYVNYNDLILDYEQNNEIFDELPSNFKLLTYNMWGLAKNDHLKKLFKLRKIY